MEKGQGPPAGNRLDQIRSISDPSVCGKGSEGERQAGVTRQQTPTTKRNSNNNHQQHHHHDAATATAEKSNSKLEAQGGDYSLLHVQQPWLAWLALMLVSVRCSETMGQCRVVLGFVVSGMGRGVGCVMGMVMRQRLRCSVLLWRSFLLLSVAVQSWMLSSGRPGLVVYPRGPGG